MAFKVNLIAGLILVTLTCVSGQGDDPFLYGYFPDDFEWGFATASYQIEGAWNEDGRILNFKLCFKRNRIFSQVMISSIFKYL